MPKHLFSILGAALCLAATGAARADGTVIHLGSPLPGVSLEVSDSQQTWTEVTDASGAYTFDTSTLPNGSYTITPAADRRSFSPETIGITIDQGSGVVIDSPDGTLDFVTVFKPSLHGFHFENYFDGKTWPGLCAGMAYSASDYYRQGLNTPGDIETPTSGPLYSYIFNRQSNAWFQPSILSSKNAYWTGIRWGDKPVEETQALTYQEFFQKVQSDLDLGIPVPIFLNLTKTESVDHNHAVLAYDYYYQGDYIYIKIYDSNYPCPYPLRKFPNDPTACDKIAVRAGIISTSYGPGLETRRVWVMDETDPSQDVTVSGPEYGFFRYDYYVPKSVPSDIRPPCGAPEVTAAVLGDQVQVCWQYGCQAADHIKVLSQELIEDFSYLEYDRTPAFITEYTVPVSGDGCVDIARGMDGMQFVKAAACNRDDVCGDYSETAAVCNWSPAYTKSCQGDFHVQSAEDLAAIQGCTTITGNVAVVFTPFTDLAGLECLTEVGGYLYLGDNRSLTDIGALSNLTTVNGALALAFDHSLTSLQGLQGVTSVGGMIIADLPLTDLAGLDNLASVDGDLILTHNTELLNVDALSSLASVGGTLRLESSHDLQDLYGLASLTSIGGDLEVVSCYSLADLDGLENLATLGGDLDMRYNYDLALCEIEQLRDRLTAGGWVDPNGIDDFVSNCDACLCQ